MSGFSASGVCDDGQSSILSDEAFIKRLRSKWQSTLDDGDDMELEKPEFAIDQNTLSFEEIRARSVERNHDVLLEV